MTKLKVFLSALWQHLLLVQMQEIDMQQSRSKNTLVATDEGQLHPLSALQGQAPKVSSSLMTGKCPFCAAFRRALPKSVERWVVIKGPGCAASRSTKATCPKYAEVSKAIKPQDFCHFFFGYANGIPGMTLYLAAWKLPVQFGFHILLPLDGWHPALPSPDSTSNTSNRIRKRLA